MMLSYMAFLCAFSVQYNPKNPKNSLENCRKFDPWMSKKSFPTLPPGGSLKCQFLQFLFSLTLPLQLGHIEI